jgi:hypothetical protein
VGGAPGDSWLRDYLDSNFGAIRGDIRDFRQDLCGVKEDLADVRERVTRLEEEATGHRRFGRVVRDWLGWALAALVFLADIIRQRWPLWP